MNSNFLKAALIALVVLPLLQGCAALAVGAAAVGVSSASDPRTIGSQLDDQNIEMKANAKLGNDERLTDYRLRVVSYDQKALLIGQVPSEELKAYAESVISDTNGIERIFNQIRVASEVSLTTQANDAWITSQVKLKLASDDQVNATDVKVVTENGEVFLMGIVGNDQASRAVEIARNVNGVTRVIKAFTAPR